MLKEQRKQNEIIINTVCPHCPLRAVSASAPCTLPLPTAMTPATLSLSLSWRSLRSLCVRWFESHNSNACQTVKLFAYALCVLEERLRQTNRQTEKERWQHSDSKTVRVTLLPTVDPISQVIAVVFVTYYNQVKSATFPLHDDIKTNDDE